MVHQTISQRFVGLLSISVGLIIVPALAKAQALDSSVIPSLQAIEAVAGGQVNVTASPMTGFVSFLTTRPGLEIPVSIAAGAPAEDRALAFLESYGAAFGIRGLDQIRTVRATPRDEVGIEHVRFQQLLRGVPVTGGELIVHLSETSVKAVNAKILDDVESIEINPTIEAAIATASALDLTERLRGVRDAILSNPRLEVFNRGILEGVRYPTRLAWFIEATGENLRESIWIDAQTGAVLLNFSQLTDARQRIIYDAVSGPALPGILVRSEGGPATGDLDVNRAYDYSGDTYNYFFSQHGRDSYDNAGAPLISTVHFCPSVIDCPLLNAFWNGSQMVYGNGFSSADDVVAHELTHAVTEHSANLFYYMQSGALNESFSDIFGETVDLTNTGGTDSSAVRWQLGEDVPGFGAIRNMQNPNLFNHPGKTSDPQFICQDPGNDAGGVHSNSGVPNHAYALMVDGGSYNGFTVSGIGLTKAGKIQYRALTQYLLSASDFLDNYNAVKQSCSDLIGTAGITGANCTEVSKALDAVQMSDPWPCNSVQTSVPAPCPNGGTPQNLFFDNLESGGGNWFIDWVGSNAWFTGNFFASSGVQHLWGDNISVTTDSRVTMVVDIPIPAAGAQMHFNHSYGFENIGTIYYDGGVIEYSTNGGSTWNDAGALIVAGAGYGGIINTCCGNPLGGRNAFVGDSFGYTASRIDLTSLAGQNVRFRFRVGTDSIFGDYGWFIDDVRIYKSPVPANLHLSGATVNSTLVHEATNSITANNYHLGASANVTLRAANRVALGPGFQAAKGSRLSIIIASPVGCH